MKKEFKIGLFLGIAILIAMALVFILGDLSSLFQKGGYVVYASFDSSAGLEEKALVRLAGVKVGKVEAILLKDYRAEVQMRINSNVSIQTDAEATLASLGLLGEKYVEIHPGKAGTFCGPGDTISGQATVGFDQIGGMLGEVAEDIKGVGTVLTDMIGNDAAPGNLRDTLLRISSVASELQEMIGDNRDNVERTIDRSAQTLGTIETKFEEVASGVSDLITQVTSNVGERNLDLKENLDKLKELFDNLEESIQILQKTLEKINEGKGSLGRLIQDEDLYEKTEKAIDSVQRMVGPVSSFKVDGGLRTEYYSSSSLVKSSLILNLRPDTKKFVQTQIIHDPWKDQFTYSLLGGMNWGAFSARAGVLESTFGFGLDLRGMKDRMVFSLEGWDFNRLASPRFRMSARYSPTKYLYLLVGLDDFALATSRQMYFGLGLGL
jgi:phospholipid/cholesterol/gamma-HCH transport system substrate-binding protein